MVLKKSAKSPNGGGTEQGLPPENKRAIRLKTIDDVRVEMARVYSDARRNSLAPESASKLVYILGQIGKTIEGSEFNKRMEELEKRQAVIEGRP